MHIRFGNKFPKHRTQVISQGKRTNVQNAILIEHKMISLVASLASCRCRHANGESFGLGFGRKHPKQINSRNTEHRLYPARHCKYSAKLVNSLLDNVSKLEKSMRLILLIILLTLFPNLCRGEASMNIPSDFPQFQVPGNKEKMQTLREMYWHHYPNASTVTTIWDQWLPAPALWPSIETDNWAQQMREKWDASFSTRPMDADGYVSVNQHPSIAHPMGWPFPFWNQGIGGYGWHFSFKDTIGPPWRPEHLNTKDGWQLLGAQDDGITEDGWKLKLTEAGAAVIAPKRDIDTFQSPFIQMRWQATGLGKDAQPYLEWATKDQPEFGSDRRFYFDPIESSSTVYSVIPMYKHPKWNGEITQLRVNFGNEPGASVNIHSLFTQYDTRHDINGQCYVRGCATYFWWSRDINFLRRSINRMRIALRYVMTEHQALERKYVFNTWVGHDGRTGLKTKPDGTKEQIPGHGIGDNYWDLLPMGHMDAYATILYYEALHCMASIEREIEAHPEWGVAGGTLKFDPDTLLKHAQEVKAEGNKLFWNSKTGRFIPAIDADGKTHDYGFTFLNFEAIYYDFATPEHAKTIMSWLNGDRIVEGDTAQGADIYHWRFAPRATTKRNEEFYFFGWTIPQTIPWGYQIQDGGAVLGWSYHDMMARLKIFGPDNAWKRLQEIVKWFDEVQTAGGYRKYYDGKREGSMQGEGTPGGLGLDCEFMESVLAPQIVMDGFLGFKPTGDGFSVNPNLPTDWPELAIDRIHFHNLTLRIRVTRDVIEIIRDGRTDEPCFVSLPNGSWKLSYINEDGTVRASTMQKKRDSDGAFEIDWSKAAGIRFDKK